MRNTLEASNVQNEKQRRSQKGGWSQARYQRHIDELRDQHVKEFVDHLDRIVREDKIQHILLAGDEVVIPMIRENLTKPLAEKVVDTLKIDITAPEHQILELTLEAMQRRNETGDRETVQRLFNEYRSGGLGVLGVRQTLAALRNGQVDELVITARLEKIEPDHERAVRDLLNNDLAGLTGPIDGSDDLNSHLASALVARARQTGARVTFIEDPVLLETVGGVGAILRYRHAEVII
jgi:peptide chain release factor subunit 1